MHRTSRPHSLQDWNVPISRCHGKSRDGVLAFRSYNQEQNQYQKRSLDILTKSYQYPDLDYESAIAIRDAKELITTSQMSFAAMCVKTRFKFEYWYHCARPALLTTSSDTEIGSDPELKKLEFKLLELLTS